MIYANIHHHQSINYYQSNDHDNGHGHGQGEDGGYDNHYITESHIIEALEQINDCDISDEAMASAMNTQVRFMAGNVNL